MNTRKIFIITASIALGLHLTGCLSMLARQELVRAQQQRSVLKKQIAASQKIEAINFIVEPPSTNVFPLLMSDDKLRKDIVGTWLSNYSTNSYSESKVNGIVNLAFNVPTTQTEMKFTFFPNGNFEGITTTQLPDLNKSSPAKSETKSRGTWKVKNGELYMYNFVEEHNKTYELKILSVWHSADSFEVRFEPNSFLRVLNAAGKYAKYPAGVKVIHSFDYYHAQSGNTYQISSMRIVQDNGQVSETKIIAKMGKMLFSKLKK